MKARILILAAGGSLVLAVSPAYAGGSKSGAARRLQSVVLPDGASAAAATRRAPTAIVHRTAKAPWEAPNRSQVARNSF
jgi:hypothetical protein